LQLAVQEVFGFMLSCTLETPVGPVAEPMLDITAVVGLAGKLCGIMSVRCSRHSAAHIASRMLGIPAEKAESEMSDAVGELCNMIAGNFKNKISGLGDGCMLSVPTVITGRDYDLHSMGNEELRLQLLFDGEPVRFCLEIQH
jgi:chemotaxis protein CheX